MAIFPIPENLPNPENLNEIRKEELKKRLNRAKGQLLKRIVQASKDGKTRADVYCPGCPETLDEIGKWAEEQGYRISVGIDKVKVRWGEKKCWQRGPLF